MRILTQDAVPPKNGWFQNEGSLLLTKKNNNSVYTQSLAVPINLIKDLTVALESMQKYTLITTLPFSKPAILITDQRNPNDKLRLVDLLMINELEFNEYINNNHPVSTSSDAVQHSLRTSITTTRDSKSRQHILWGVKSVSFLKKLNSS